MSSESVAAHYGRGGLGAAILAALDAAGKDTAALTQDDLASVDELHIRGREATAEVAEAAGIGPGQRVLDVGCGIGGPSRYLAAARGCEVTGLDLTQEFCDVATMLAERTGLTDRVSYRQGDALDMPFEDASFDVAWTQHAAMNIADKPRLYAEMRRVLKPGGCLAIYDILAGPAGPIHFPVPWAHEPSISFLATPDELRALLTGAGFQVKSWRDTTAAAADWFARVRAQAEDGSPPLNNLALLFGDLAPTLAGNMARNVGEQRILTIQIVARAAG